MKPFFVVAAALLLSSCVSYQLPGPDPATAVERLVVDSNIGGPSHYLQDLGQASWYFMPRTVYAKSGDGVVRIRQTSFKAMNKAGWGSDILAKTATYQVLWQGTILSRGVTRQVEVALRVRSKIASDQRTKINPFAFEDLRITVDSELWAESQALPAKGVWPLELFSLPASGHVVALGNLHAPLFQESTLETREVNIIDELTRGDLRLRLTSEGRVLAVTSALRLDLEAGAPDETVFEATVTNLLTVILGQLVKG